MMLQINGHDAFLLRMVNGVIRCPGTPPPILLRSAHENGGPTVAVPEAVWEMIAVRVNTPYPRSAGRPPGEVVLLEI